MDAAGGRGEPGGFGWNGFGGEPGGACLLAGRLRRGTLEARFLAGRLWRGSFRRRGQWTVRPGRARLRKGAFLGGHLRVRRNRERHPGRAFRAMLWEMKGTSLEALQRGKEAGVRRPEM